MDAWLVNDATDNTGESEKKLEKIVSEVKQPPSDNLACQALVHENLDSYNQLFHQDPECS